MKKILSTAIGRWIVGAFIALIVRLIYTTCRKKYINKTPQKERHTPAIYATWHGRLILQPFMLPRPTYALMSKHRDGRLMRCAAWWFRLYSIPGSSSKGGAHALRLMARTLKEGKNISITPDGPRGPHMKAKPGVMELARLTGAPIIPITFSATRYWRASSWDHFMIPKPFSTLYIKYGTPLFVSKKEDKAHLLNTIETALTQNQEEGDAACISL